jgi:hypothetical protein
MNRSALLATLLAITACSSGTVEDTGPFGGDGASGPDRTAPRDADSISNDGGVLEDGAADRDAAPSPDARSDGGAALDGGFVDSGLMSLDPAPGFDMPGEYGCPGCPDTSLSELTIMAGNATAWTFSGTISNAISDGTYFVRGPNGQELVGPIPTDTTAGTFSFTTPLFCGTQIVKCLWSNTAGTYVAVVQVITTGCIPPDIQATITWDELGRDWELHLIKPGGRINDNATDCTWTSCIGSSPDWGVQGEPLDDPSKDVDNTGTSGTENIFLARPETGVFTVMVEHWGSGDPGSDGRAIINLSNGQRAVIEIMDLAPRFVRTVATIEWPSGIIRTSTVVHDCTMNWSGGCRDQIP